METPEPQGPAQEGHVAPPQRGDTGRDGWNAVLPAGTYYYSCCVVTADRKARPAHWVKMTITNHRPWWRRLFDWFLGRRPPTIIVAPENRP